MTNEENKDFAGKNGFVWWIGVVEDRQDPLKLGRVRVRCAGWHAEDKMRLPTNMLPWAMPSYPSNHAHTYAPKDGDMVFGFFIDGENAQEPVVLGVIPGIPLKAANPQNAFNDSRTDEQLKTAPRPPESKTYKTDGTGIVIKESAAAKRNPINLDEPTTSRIARNDSDTITKTYIQERKDNVVKNVPTFNSNWSEPTTQYAARYPHNYVIETESGHLFELDDSFGKERIHLAHRSGTFHEIFPNGDKVEKITRNNYQIVMADDHIYVMGKCNITVQGDAEIFVQKNAYAKVTGNAEVNIGGNVNVKVGGNYRETVGGTYSVSSGGKMSFSAPRIDMN